MTQRQVIVTWFTPEEKTPPSDEAVVVSFTGRDGAKRYENALGLAYWYSGWSVDGLSEKAKFIINAWCDLDTYIAQEKDSHYEQS